MKRWSRVAGMSVLICFLCGNVFADWIDTFSGGQFDLPTWQLRAYPQVPGVTQYTMVYRQGKSGIFGQNEQEDPPGFHTTFDDVSSRSEGASALCVHPLPWADDVSICPKLNWMETEFSQGRQLWFGPKDHMTLVDPALSGMTYDPGVLKTDTIYEWRVDQIGSEGPVTGNTWEFTTGQCLVIDTFESYADDAAIEAAWPHNIPSNPVSGQAYHYVFVETAEAVHGDRAIRIEFQNQYTPFMTEATRTFDAPQDWTVVPNPHLALEFRGQDDNVEQRLYVTLEDAAGGRATVVHAFNYAVQSESWRHWTGIDLAEFSGVDIGAVTAITLGIGDGTDSGQMPEDRDQVTIDDIRIFPVPHPYGR